MFVVGVLHIQLKLKNHVTPGILKLEIKSVVQFLGSYCKTEIAKQVLFGFSFDGYY
jgi:hypothetical protein